MTVAVNLKQVNEQIQQACLRSKRNVSDVTVIAVTKYVSVERAKEALACGIHNLAENRREGLLEKQTEIARDQAVWHLIGTLQTRKVKDVIGKIDYFHALDRLKLAEEIQKRMSDERLKCLIEVNVSGEESKHGLSIGELDSFLTRLADFPAIEVAGLMTMAPNTADTDLIRSVFRRLRELRDSIQERQLSYAPCTELSMGMSHDYPIAVEEGATFVRIGTALVGNEQKGS
ncbi:YggS family pyridoxal phosphate-dependent enzyme [Sporolactobacillus spathodeae]|uniref:Pyridoxal phosphate homeostasis protein n=1 Tax=Sporolactobacillus spathodeae TaxID=1465502 RepID=A0ABS2Q932_9BACL|nr:pyridoxal phosphate enzyme (YggS family) [Sporolactobacillus spathodeae]